MFFFARVLAFSRKQVILVPRLKRAAGERKQKKNHPPSQQNKTNKYGKLPPAPPTIAAHVHDARVVARRKRVQQVARLCVNSARFFRTWAWLAIGYRAIDRSGGKEPSGEGRAFFPWEPGL